MKYGKTEFAADLISVFNAMYDRGDDGVGSVDAFLALVADKNALTEEAVKGGKADAIAALLLSEKDRQCMVEAFSGKGAEVGAFAIGLIAATAPNALH